MENHDVVDSNILATAATERLARTWPEIGSPFVIDASQRESLLELQGL